MYNKITPFDDPVINKNSNICIIDDHMPELIYNWSGNLENHRQSNTIQSILDNSMPHVDTLIFNDYNYINGFDTYKIFYAEKIFNYEAFSYNRLKKQNTINFVSKTKKFNYISNKPRIARFLASCWIANNYKNYSEFNYTQSYVYDHFKDSLNGFISNERLQLESTMLPKKWIPSKLTNKPASYRELGNAYGTNNYNFYNIIKNEIVPTVFSIVMEPVFWENGCMLTEKYINAILGGTIPIVNGYQVYEIIKQMGFDSFEDIIDTSSQFETNPTLRIVNLLENNKNQIDNAIDLIKNKNIQERLVNNIKILENYNYNLAKSRYSTEVVEFLKQSGYK